MKKIFLFLAVSVFAVSVNAANNTGPSIETKCSIGYHKVNNECVKLYCNDLPKKKEEIKKSNSSAK